MVEFEGARCCRTGARVLGWYLGAEKLSDCLFKRILRLKRQSDSFSAPRYQPNIRAPVLQHLAPSNSTMVEFEGARCCRTGARIFGWYLGAEKLSDCLFKRRIRLKRQSDSFSAPRYQPSTRAPVLQHLAPSNSTMTLRQSTFYKDQRIRYRCDLHRYKSQHPRARGCWDLYRWRSQRYLIRWSL